VELHPDGWLAPKNTEVRTKLGNFVENKGFSTVLNMRLRSTIQFGHASAARDP
jgi:hypothetical protein